MKSPSKIVSSFKESIFSTMTAKANKLGAINLSQGFPDFDGPQWIQELVTQAMQEGHNQYAPGPGTMELRTSIKNYLNKYYQLNYNENTEVTVTNGATEALFCSSLALINPGDEVILFEPYYDSYMACIKMAGGIPVPVTLYGPDFSLDKEKIEKAFSSKTKAIFLNTPHNPTGKVFSKDELSFLSKLILKHDTYVISDEVYEFLTFDDHNHIPIATLPSMKERTLTISSAGKTFGLTGWKVGWCAAPESLTKAIRMVHQFNTFSVAHPFQLGMAKAIDELEDHLKEFKPLYLQKRNLFYEGLKKANLNPIPPQGTYFIMCRIPEELNLTDIEYCYELMEKKKVAAIPPSAFYSLDTEEGKKYIRLCFAKNDETLIKAISSLQ